MKYIVTNELINASGKDVISKEFISWMEAEKQLQTWMNESIEGGFNLVRVGLIKGGIAPQPYEELKTITIKTQLS